MNKEYLPLLVNIIQGLLASGHYTSAHQDSSDDYMVVMDDMGKDWKENGLSRRYHPRVVEDAEMVLGHALRIFDENAP